MSESQKATSLIVFPNGMLWQVDQTGVAWGVVHCPPAYEDIDHEARLDAIAEAATGSVCGLEGFDYALLGGDRVSFSGSVAEMPDWDDADDALVAAEEGWKRLDPFEDRQEIIERLIKQFSLNDFEADHALDCLVCDMSYADETVVSVFGSGRELRAPSGPSKCSYVRVTVGGWELMYWHQDEWREAPAEVMGALIGLLKDPRQEGC